MPRTSVIMRQIRPFLLAIFTVCMASAATAQTTVAYVDVEYIIWNSPQYQGSIKVHENKFTPQYQELGKLSSKHKRNGQVLKREGGIWTDEERNLFISQNMQLLDEYNKQNKWLSKEEKKERDHIYQSVKSLVLNLIKNHAELNNIDSVDQNAAYSDPRLNITQVILNEMIRLNGG